MLGIDGSILAVSDRNGKLALWTYVQGSIGQQSSLLMIGTTSYGRQKRFQRLASISIGSPANWIADISWSDWTVKGDTCGQKLELTKAIADSSVGEAALALIFTDGSVQLLKIQQHAKQKPDGPSQWNCTTGEPISVDNSDHRPVTAVKWVKVIVWFFSRFSCAKEIQ